MSRPPANSKRNVDHYSQAERFSKTEYLVEADHEHTGALWQSYSQGAYEMGYRTPSLNQGHGMSWEQLSGIGIQVGEIDNRPVMLSIMWVKIGGALIGFFYGMSQVVDHKMIRNYLDEKFKGVPRTEAANFHHVLGYIKNRDPAKKVDLEEDKRSLGREYVEEFQEHGTLSTALLMGYTMETCRRESGKGDPSVDEVMGALDDVQAHLKQEIEKFSQAVWSSWLKKHYREHQFAGLKATVGNIELLVGGCAGRVLLTMSFLDQVGTHVTLIGLDGQKDHDRLSIQGIRCNKDDAIRLLQEVTKFSADILKNIQPDCQVSII